MKVAEVKKQPEEKPVEKPVFENPRISAICMEFDWKLDNGDSDGALKEVSGCVGNGAGMLVAYAIERLDAAGAMDQADVLRMKKGNTAGDVEHHSKESTTTADKLRHAFRRVSRQ